MSDNSSFMSRSSAKRSSFDAGLRSHMLRIYSRMSLGVLVTAIVSFFVGNSRSYCKCF